MISTIQFKGEVYPAFQAQGFAAKFAFPFAKEVCKGRGYDIGCNRLDWSFPESMIIDPAINPEWHALYLPWLNVDYIFSSHMLEHVNDWVGVLNYWHSVLKPSGVLFLYLPDFSQVYWRPHHNRKHVNAFTPEILKSYFKDQPDMWNNVFVSGVDLNSSFMVMAQKV
jgi:SAM-dependent methyltransferase